MIHEIPVLDRKPFFDSRSRNYAISTLYDKPVNKRKRVWTTLKHPLDQGREGQCVIFGWGAELAATPKKYPIDNPWCRTMWPTVQAEDRAMGNYWQDGASVLAGAKSMRKHGNIAYYAWAFGIDDVTQTLMRKGPVLLGINWYESMYDTTPEGLVRIYGPLVGGHCIMANGYWPNHPLFGEVIVWTNSWGPSYGINGRGYIRVTDLDKLLRQDGEACVPTDIAVRSD